MKKSIIVIGASGGIGECVCKVFAKEGYNIIATYFNNDIEELKNYCEKFTTFSKCKLNVCDDKAISTFFEKSFKENLYIESVINCAGISMPEKLLIDESEENIDKILDVNLKGAILISKEAMRNFIKFRHGIIINISSVYGIYGGCCESVYSATKGGIIALTKALALECANFNVRVNAIAPGFISTNMTKGFNDNEKEDIKNATPLNRLGMPEDVASAVKFLTSESASFITGEILEVSGGAIKF